MANQEISEVVRQLAKVVRDLAQTRANPVHDPTGEIFKKIAQSKPPLYSGEIEPSVLENWLREFDKLIVAVNCPENLRVNSDVYYLR
ncbi:hypothetical protein SOVF_072650, partial [Spinacia oleracea]